MGRVMFFFLLIIFPFTKVDAQATDSLKSGETLFYDNFSKDITGKFPVNWISNRPGEVVALKSGKWFKMHSEGTYVPRFTRELPKEFTVEFDYIHQTIGNGNTTAEFTLFNRTKGTQNDDLFPGKSGVKIILETFIVSCLCYNNADTVFRPSAEFRGKLLQTNNKARITIIVNDSTLRLLVDGFECLNVPQCWKHREPLNAMRFYLWGSQAEPMISNIKIF